MMDESVEVTREPLRRRVLVSMTVVGGLLGLALAIFANVYVCMTVEDVPGAPTGCVTPFFGQHLDRFEGGIVYVAVGAAMGFVIGAIVASLARWRRGPLHRSET